MKTDGNKFDFSFTDVPCEDLVRALEEVLEDESYELMMDIVNKDIIPAKDSITNKVSAVKDGLVSVFRYGKQVKEESKDISELSERIFRDGKEKAISIKESTVENFKWAKEKVPLIKDATVDFISRVRSDFRDCPTPQDKILYISVIAAYVGVFSVGFNQGISTPDKDFKLWGPGRHRSFLTHSVAPTIVVWLASAFVVRLFERAGAKLAKDSGSHTVIKQIILLTKLFAAGFGTGVATHLFLDTFRDTGGTIRFHDIFGNKIRGTLIKGTRVDDLAYTAIHSYFSAIVSDDEFDKFKQAI